VGIKGLHIIAVTLTLK